VLGTFSKLGVRSEEIRGGEDESSIMKKWENYQKELNRLTQVEEAQTVFGNNYVRFLDDLEPVIVSLDAYSTRKLPPIPGEACHRFHAKAATCSTRKLPLIP
jgi:hypothetical protein